MFLLIPWPNILSAPQKGDGEGGGVVVERRAGSTLWTAVMRRGTLGGGGERGRVRSGAGGAVKRMQFAFP